MTKDKVMFEIYREAEYNGRYHVVYFSELNEGNKEFEINKAMAGEHYLDGFFLEEEHHSAKEAIADLLNELNAGSSITQNEAEQRLLNVLVS